MAEKADRWRHLHEWVNLLLCSLHTHTAVAIVLLGRGGPTACLPLSEQTCTHAVKEGREDVQNKGAQAVTVNVNGDSSCGINVAHLGGPSWRETAALKVRKRCGKGRADTETKRKCVPMCCGSIWLYNVIVSFLRYGIIYKWALHQVILFLPFLFRWIIKGW